MKKVDLPLKIFVDLCLILSYSQVVGLPQDQVFIYKSKLPLVMFSWEISDITVTSYSCF